MTGLPVELPRVPAVPALGLATSETMPHEMARLRPRCPDCDEWCEWMWRCFCYVDDPPRVHDCEERGIWWCRECGEKVEVMTVAV